MKLTRLLAILTLLVVSCASEIDTGPQRPEPSEPATGPIVAEMTVEDADFALYDEGAGCVAVEIAYPGLQPTVERHCFRGEEVLSRTEPCGWLDPQDETAREFDCDVELPVVLYGRVTTPHIGFVCIGTIEATADPGTGVTGARFVEMTDAGFILEAAGPGESPAAHLFTRGGLRYGEPPLDAPSDPIYRMCEAEAPWGTTEVGYGIEVWITIDESLQTDEIGFGVAGGMGGEATGGGAWADQPGPQMFYLDVPSSGRDLSVWVETTVEGDPLLEADLPWPPEFLQVLAGEMECRVSRIAVHIAAGARSGDADAIAVSWDGNDCGAS